MFCGTDVPWDGEEKYQGDSDYGNPFWSVDVESNPFIISAKGWMLGKRKSSSPLHSNNKHLKCIDMTGYVVIIYQLL